VTTTSPIHSHSAAAGAAAGGPAGDTDAARAANKALVRRVYDEVLNGRRLDLADALVAPDFVDRFGRNPDLRGPETLKAVARPLFEGFPDLHFQVEDVLAEGDRVALRWTMTGTNTAPFRGFPPTGQTVRVAAIVLYRVRDGRLAEFWPMVDLLGLLTQLGRGPQMQPPAPPAP
jgi:steroid delta-isomerase-like uncharacterized protein